MRHTMRQFGLGDVTSVDAWTPIRITLAEYFATGQIEKPRTVSEFEAYEGIKAVFPTQAMLNDYVINLATYKARLAATPPTEPLQPFQVEAASKIYAVIKGKAAMGQALKAQDQLAVALTLVDPKDAKSVAAVKAADPTGTQAMAAVSVSNGQGGLLAVDSTRLGAVSAAKLRKQFQSESGTTMFILIGKDGTEKLRKDTVKIEDLFEVIDAMPMRKREAESRNPG